MIIIIIRIFPLFYRYLYLYLLLFSLFLPLQNKIYIFREFHLFILVLLIIIPNTLYLYCCYIPIIIIIIIIPLYLLLIHSFHNNNLIYAVLDGDVEVLLVCLPFQFFYCCREYTIFCYVLFSPLSVLHTNRQNYISHKLRLLNMASSPSRGHDQGHHQI